MARLIAGLEGGVVSSPRARLLCFHRLVFLPPQGRCGYICLGWRGGDQRPAVEVWEREIPLIHT